MAAPVIDGRTRVAGVIGSPIHHSLSPTIHNAAFGACGLNWVFCAFEVRAGEGAAAVAAMRTLGLAGLSVTMPHKDAVVETVDELTPAAARLGAVNCIVATDKGRLVGDNTDGDGFLDALALDPGFDPAGRRCVVLGAGGAARAVVLALAGEGAAEVAVVNRTPEKGERAAALAGPVGRTASAPEVVSEADLVVNATSVGMGSNGGLPLDVDLLRTDQLVVDLVYEPPLTPLVKQARARGIAAVGGVGMLVHQAARAFRQWTGQEPPIDAMTTAAEAAIAQR